jgi:hypothetical protein
VNATVPLTVTAPPPPPPPPVVTAINVMSANASINVGGTQQFSALATDQHGLAMSGVVFTGCPAILTCHRPQRTGERCGDGHGADQRVGTKCK